MSNELLNITGSGSGGGGGKGATGDGGRTPVEASDTLKSRMSITIIDLLGEGEIGGLLNGARSIYANEVPIQAEDGEFNFSDVAWDFRSGAQAQLPLDGIADIESPTQVNVKISKATPYTFRISDPNADRVRIIISVPSMLTRNTKTGDINGSTCRLKIEVKADDAPSWTQDGQIMDITGKSSSVYKRARIITLPPATSHWDIRITRLTDDSTTVNQCDSYMDSYVKIIDQRLSYPNSAVVKVTLNPTRFSSIPKRSYRVRGLYVPVPTNYNPDTRVYSGIWDGTFKPAVTDNPAWILFDLLTNTRYGLGSYLNASANFASTQIADNANSGRIDTGSPLTPPPSEFLSQIVDRATLYRIAQYCDEMVDNGNGGTEPRFTINTVIQTQSEAYKLISDITSVFRGMAYWNGGMIGFTFDAPSDPVMTFAPANVIDGVFNYAGAARKDRHSAVNVSWNDPGNNFKQVIEYVEDQELVNAIGIRKLDTVAFGCTSQAQANRAGRWILYTERYESNLITFKVGLDCALLVPGEVIKIHDPFRAGKRMGGRIISATATSATLDSPVTLASSGAVISIRLPDGTFADRTVIQSAGDHSTLTWASALSAVPEPNAIFIVAETNLQPLLARVVGIAPDKNGTEFSITAVEHNPTKYAAVESGYQVTPIQTTPIDPYFSNPTNLVLVESTYLASNGDIAVKLSISWTGTAKSYEVSWRRRESAENGTTDWTTVITEIPGLDVYPVLPGVYEVTVVGISALGKRSSVLSNPAPYFTVLGKIAPPALPTGVIATGDFRSIHLTWVNPIDADFDHVDIYSSETNDSLTATLLASVTGTDYTHSAIESSSVHYYWLKSFDTTGNSSAFTSSVSARVSPARVDPMKQTGYDEPTNHPAKTANYEKVGSQDDVFQLFKTVKIDPVAPDAKMQVIVKGKISFGGFPDGTSNNQGFTHKGRVYLYVSEQHPQSGDRDWRRVKSLLKFQSGFTDERGIAWTNTGVSITPNAGVFDTSLDHQSAALFSTTGTTRLTTAANAAFGGRTLTVEAWVKHDGSGGMILDLRNAVGDAGAFFIDPTTKGVGFIGAAQSYFDSNGPTVPTAVWTHLRWVKKKNLVYMFVNGRKAMLVNLKTQNDTASLNFGTTRPARIGSAIDNTMKFGGYIGEVRVTKMARGDKDKSFRVPKNLSPTSSLTGNIGKPVKKGKMMKFTSSKLKGKDQTSETAEINFDATLTATADSTAPFQPDKTYYVTVGMWLLGSPYTKINSGRTLTIKFDQ